MALRCLAFNLALLVAGIPATAQAPTGSVEGRVICSDGNVPARSASVELVPLARLLAAGCGSKTTYLRSLKSRTDFNGNYALDSVPAGTYVVYVSEPGYSSDLPLVRKVLDQFTREDREKLLANFPEVTIEAGGTARENVVIYRGGAITGRVSIDTGGTPGKTAVIATMVSSDLLGDMNDSKRKEPLHFALTGTTDDRGVYRIAGLPAGTYRIQVMLVEQFQFDNGSESFRPTRAGTGSVMVFAPDALKQSDAKLVKVGEGDELSDIDITLPLSRLHSISGTVTQDGAPVAGAFLSLARQGQKNDEADIESFEDENYQNACELTGMICANGGNDATSMSDGSYRFDLLPPGIYTIKAQRHPSFTKPVTGHSTAASAKITIQINDRDIPDANIDLPAQANPPTQVSGK